MKTADATSGMKINTAMTKKVVLNARNPATKPAESSLSVGKRIAKTGSAAVTRATRLVNSSAKRCYVMNGCASISPAKSAAKFMTECALTATKPTVWSANGHTL